MKQIAMIVFALLCITAANAQAKGSGVEIGIGADVGVPVGNDLKPYTRVGFGGDATLGYNFDDKYALLVRGGYMTFLTKGDFRDHHVKNISDGFVKVVGRYTIPRSLFFIEPQFGLSSFKGGSGSRYGVGTSGLTYGVAAGIFLNKSKAFDVSMRYEASTCQKGINFVGLRFAYSLKPGTYF